MVMVGAQAPVVEVTKAVLTVAEETEVVAAAEATRAAGALGGEALAAVATAPQSAM